MDTYDVVIIGAGPAGYPCAIRCSQNGLKTLLIEKLQIGGTCLNRGCIPTKALFEIAKQIEKSPFDGINKTTSFDWEKIIGWIESKVVSRLRTGVNFLLKTNNIDVISGVNGEIKESGLVLAGNKEIKAKTIVISTGARPSIPAVFATDEKIITSDSIWKINKLPESLTIVGGGFIGCEFASILNTFGIKVSICEMTESLLPGKDREMVQYMEKIFTQKGIDIACNRGISDLSSTGTEKILWATGRRPNSENFISLGLKMEKGSIVVNENMETSIKDIYAIGDINGKYQLAYVATKQGEILADILVGKKDSINYTNIPDSIFTFPNMASCGLTEQQALSQNYSIKTGKCSYQAIGRAYASGSTTGMVKIIAEQETHKILGVHIIGENAPEMIHLAELAITKNMTAKQWAEIYFCHPTFSESIMEALLEIEDKPIHLPPKKSAKK
ncbi:MAG: dihydrolipoyl dehydrogenase [Candidatus Omnitrophica bacterium]|jgi:dihydrolipoamide dehydrogenase|nr:dihydrolipoyl dehydrogenase [Candidatus Omnitrophota bacterium]